MIMPKNIRTRAYGGEVICELVEPSIADWNAKAAKSRKALYLKLYGMDPTDDKEAQQGIDRYFKK
jgi:hypothetical protein